MVKNKENDKFRHKNVKNNVILKKGNNYEKNNNIINYIYKYVYGNICAFWKN